MSRHNVGVPELSIVSTLYLSARTVREFYERCCAAAELLGLDYELVLVDDGSPDESLQLACELAAADPRVRVIELSRNFGHHRALMTGLSFAKGRSVFLIDSDLEEEPEWLERFWKVLEDEAADVVYGLQEIRRGSFFQRLTGRLFYVLFNLLSEHTLVGNPVVARLMVRRYVDALLLHRERELLIAGLWEITGFHQIPVTVAKKRKESSTYTLRRRTALFVRGITAFSSKPLVYIAYLGALVSLVAAVYIIYLLVIFAVAGDPPAGFTSLLASIWLLGGLTILSIGVVAIYLSVIFTETKERPYTIVRAVHQHGSERSAADEMHMGHPSVRQVIHRP